MAVAQATHSSRTSLRRHTQEIRVGEGGYATIADAVAYCNSLVTLNTQNRVRIAVDNGIYDEGFVLPKFCDMEGESESNVILRRQAGGHAPVTPDQGATDKGGFFAMYSCSLIKTLTFSVDAKIQEVDQFEAALTLMIGESMVAGSLDKVTIDADNAFRALNTLNATVANQQKLDYYLQFAINDSTLICGAEGVVLTDGYYGALNFYNSVLTGGEQLQGLDPWQPYANGVFEFWGVFFGGGLGNSSIAPECNFKNTVVKQFDMPNNPSVGEAGLQAFNLEFFQYSGGRANCIDSTFETVKADPNDGRTGSPIFISAYQEAALKTNPNATYKCFTDGCQFIKNSNYADPYDIRYVLDSFHDMAPMVTWGGNGQEPLVGESGGLIIP